MTGELHRLVYYSRNAIGGSDAEIEREVRQILAASRANNARVAVTGALMFNRGCFAQVLEGARGDIEATFERIQRDPRHGDVVVLEFARADGRGFPSWSMAFVGQSESGRDLFGDMAADSGFDPASLSGERVFEALRNLVIEEEDIRAAG